MFRHSVLIAICLGLAGCGRSTADYERAAKAHWPGIQADEAARADQLERDAVGWDRSAASSARIARSFNGGTSDGPVAEAHAQQARDMRAEAAEARAVSMATLTSVRNVRCAPAAPQPGENCEMTITLRDKQGGNHDNPAKWRFDVVDGQLQVVGS